ncbi:MAG: hypothetical protein JW863_00035 [Chitinispirillaceae bacterium]|nr:hypothetical protein [Chitinispirillaceae bacterium]
MAIGSITPDIPRFSDTSTKKSHEPPEEELESFDPRFSARKLLIEQMFGVKNEESESLSKTMNRLHEDSVEISSEAMALYQSSSMEFSAKTADGGEIRVSLRSETAVAAGLSTVQTDSADPLVLDLDGDGIELTDVTRERVRFDIDADGSREEVAWVRPDDGMLVLDRNGNGSIDDGRELFGDQNGARNGFEELAGFDENGDGVIDGSDSIFGRLGVWRDRNADGVSDAGEVQSLNAYAIESIALTSDGRSHYVAGNLVDGYAGYTGKNGGGSVGEVFLNYVV